jgi:hypothetical protein
MMTIKPLLLLLASLAGGALAALAVAVMFALYVGSVVSNIGRRPVVLQPHRSRPPTQRTRHAQRSPAH